MKHRSPQYLAYAFCILGLAMPQGALAQNGLQLNPAVPDALRDEPALRLRLDSPHKQESPGLIAGPTLQAPQFASQETTGGARASALWADWRPFGNGLKTSVGLVWQDNLLREPSTASDFAMSGFDSRNRLSSTPFLGFGWSSDPDREGWQLSAEVGAYAASGDQCRGSVYRCAANSSMGLKPTSSTEGIRWTPYFSLGVSLQY